MRPTLRQIFCASALCLGFVSTGALGVESLSDVVVDTTEQRSASAVRPNILLQYRRATIVLLLTLLLLLPSYVAYRMKRTPSP
jgi:hypothetical protein